MARRGGGTDCSPRSGVPDDRRAGQPRMHDLTRFRPKTAGLLSLRFSFGGLSLTTLLRSSNNQAWRRYCAKAGGMTSHARCWPCKNRWCDRAGINISRGCKDGSGTFASVESYNCLGGVFLHLLMQDKRPRATREATDLEEWTNG